MSGTRPQLQRRAVPRAERGPQNKGGAIGIKTARTYNTITSKGKNWLGRKDSNLHRPH
jgi:hypothetical protein